jgi:hypothetical protein
VSKTVAGLIAVIVLLSVLVSAGPTLVALVQELVPVVLVVGLVAILMRLAWWLTGRW